jgi:exosortase
MTLSWKVNQPMILNAAKVWLLPLATAALFFYLLIAVIPYATGYGWLKVPLSVLIPAMWAFPDWVQGFFVPFICLFLIFLQRKKIAQAPIQGSPWGAALIVFGVAIYCLGLKAETEYFGFAAIQILLAGLVLWFWGPKVFGILSFTWFFFLFTWPMPFLSGMIALPLRLIMSHTSYEVLNFIGTPCLQSGTAILSAPNMAAGIPTGQTFSIDIADPCSGLHSLFALMMLSALAGYVCINNLVLRWLVFFSSIPLAIAGNVVRILLLVWGAKHFGTSFAIGTDENPSAFHMGCGYAVYLVALMLLMALIAFFNSNFVLRRGKKASAAPAAGGIGELSSS